MYTIYDYYSSIKKKKDVEEKVFMNYYFSTMYNVILKPNKEKQLLKHHPWVFSGAIDNIEPKFVNGDLAKVFSSDNKFIAYGYYDEKSHIILHLLSWDEQIIPDDSFLVDAIKSAIYRRKDHFNKDRDNAFRLIHGEADFIPGLACDVYASHLKLIVSSRYAYFNINIIKDTLIKLLKPETITVIMDKEYAKAEALPQKILYFDNKGEKIEEGEKTISFYESGIRFEIENTNSQKSGFYCDQRDNRNIVESYCEGKTVLDACSYTGAFTLHALRGGALSVDALDQSESALRHLLYQVHLNEEEGIIPPSSRDKVTIKSCDVFDEMRRIESNKYDFIILDPPKLAATKGKLENALKAYKDLNRNAMLKIKNGGLIASFSCSGSVTREILRQQIAYAAADAGLEIQIIRTLSAGDDHPIRISFPESEYLKGFIYRVIR